MNKKTQKTTEAIENRVLKKFEMTEVTMEVVEGHLMFELYSTAMALGYTKTNTVKGKTYTQCRKDRVKKIMESLDFTGLVHNGLIYLTEDQLYDFMLEARTEKCKPFRKWITTEVIPTIRLTGAYIMPDSEEDMVNFYFSQFSDDTKLQMVNELTERNKELQQFYDDLINTEGLYSMNTVSKEMNGIGLKTLYKYLRSKEVMFYKDNINIPYQRFMNQGLFKVKETQCQDGKYRSVTYATKKGLEYIRKMLRKDGIIGQFEIE